MHIYTHTHIYVYINIYFPLHKEHYTGSFVMFFGISHKVFTVFFYIHIFRQLWELCYTSIYGCLQSSVHQKKYIPLQKTLPFSTVYICTQLCPPVLNTFFQVIKTLQFFWNYFYPGIMYSHHSQQERPGWLRAFITVSDIRYALCCCVAFPWQKFNTCPKTAVLLILKLKMLKHNLITLSVYCCLIKATWAYNWLFEDIT